MIQRVIGGDGQFCGQNPLSLMLRPVRNHEDIHIPGLPENIIDNRALPELLPPRLPGMAQHNPGNIMFKRILDQPIRQSSPGMERQFFELCPDLLDKLNKRLFKSCLLFRQRTFFIRKGNDNEFTIQPFRYLLAAPDIYRTVPVILGGDQNAFRRAGRTEHPHLLTMLLQRVIYPFRHQPQSQLAQHTQRSPLKQGSGFTVAYMPFRDTLEQRFRRYINQADFICKLQCMRRDGLLHLNPHVFLGQFPYAFQLIYVYRSHYTDSVTEQEVDIFQSGLMLRTWTVPVRQTIHQNHLRIPQDQCLHIQILFFRVVMNPMNTRDPFQLPDLFNRFRALERGYRTDDDIDSLLLKRRPFPQHMIGFARPAYCTNENF
ncbi:hypothetical protein D3C75_612250 [compost metagenome]